MQKLWEEWRKGKLFKVNNGGDRIPNCGWLKEEEGIFIPPSKNVTVAVPGADYLG
jgi:hypothetical protein